MSAPPTHPPERHDRRRDLVALVLFALGALLFIYGYAGLSRLATRPIPVVPGVSAVQRAERFRALSLAGGALIVLGAGAAAFSFWRFRRAQRPPA